MKDIESEEDDDWNPNPLSHQNKQSLLNPSIIKFKVDESHSINDFSKPIPQKNEESDTDSENIQDYPKDQCPFDFPINQNKKEQETYDDMLYNPCEDELNQAWINKTTQSDSSNTFQLSCSQCFKPLTYQGQTFKSSKSEYQAKEVIPGNVIINESQIVKSNKIIGERDEKFEMFFLKCHCKGCSEEIGLYDIEKKMYLLNKEWPLFFYLKAIFISKTTPYTQRRIQKQNILYVIAHPDDEAMFFVPSILELKKQNNLYLLCLSNGNADGLGKLREKELAASAKYLGFQEWEVIDEPELQDGMKSYWDPRKVADTVKAYLKSKQGENEITFIVTFDEKGISGHPNHIAVHKGIGLLFEENTFAFDVLTLTTVNFIRKYIGYADIYNCLPDSLHYFLLTPITSYKAMSLHHSQFVWFRKLFTVFSRYAYCNSFEQYTQNPDKYKRQIKK